ncbi:MAG TPA: hypothetical protein GXZ93_00365 [Actinobacteria bacterium]|jgi:uncharacterized protein YkwD|nr:hypothetical protein [Actinomycetota bacterium]
MKAKIQKVKNLSILISVAAILTLLLISSAGFMAPKGSIEVQGKSTFNKNSSSGSVIAKEAALTEYENHVAALINNIRVENGLAPVAADGALTDVAIARSQDMINRNYFSHYTPEGTNVFNFLRGAGIRYRYAGENLAQCQPASIGSPEAFVDAWMNSPSHRANILRAQYGKIGVSMVETEGRRVVTTVFTN